MSISWPGHCVQRICVSVYLCATHECEVPEHQCGSSQIERECSILVTAGDSPITLYQDCQTASGVLCFVIRQYFEKDTDKSMKREGYQKGYKKILSIHIGNDSRDCMFLIWWEKKAKGK